MIWYETWFKNLNDTKWQHHKSETYHSKHGDPHYKFDMAITIRYNDEIKWPHMPYGDVIKYTKLKEGEREDGKSADKSGNAASPVSAADASNSNRGRVYQWPSQPTE